MSDIDTIKNSTDSVHQYILSLSAEILKEAFFYLEVNISDMPNLKKHMVVVDIAQRWGRFILEEIEINGLG